MRLARRPGMRANRQALVHDVAVSLAPILVVAGSAFVTSRSKAASAQLGDEAHPRRWVAADTETLVER